MPDFREHRRKIHPGLSGQPTTQQGFDPFQVNMLNAQRGQSIMAAKISRATAPATGYARPHRAASIRDTNGDGVISAGERVDHIERPDGSLIPVAAATGDQYLIRPKGANHYVSPGTGERFKPDPTSPTGLSSIGSARDEAMQKAAEKQAKVEAAADKAEAKDAATAEKDAVKANKEAKRLENARATDKLIAEGRAYHLSRETGTPLPVQSDEEFKAAKAEKMAKLQQDAAAKPYKKRLDELQLELANPDLPKVSEKDQKDADEEHAAATIELMAQRGTDDLSTPLTDEEVKAAQADPLRKDAAAKYLAAKEQAAMLPKRAAKRKALEKEVYETKKRILDPLKYGTDLKAEAPLKSDDELKAHASEIDNRIKARAADLNQEQSHIAQKDDQFSQQYAFTQEKYKEALASGDPNVIGTVGDAMHDLEQQMIQWQGASQDQRASVDAQAEQIKHDAGHLQILADEQQKRQDTRQGEYVAALDAALPGAGKRYGDALADGQKRAQDLADKYPDPFAPEAKAAFDALHKDFSDKTGAIAKEAQAKAEEKANQQGVISQVYEGMRSAAMQDQKANNDKLTKEKGGFTGSLQRGMNWLGKAVVNAEPLAAESPTFTNKGWYEAGAKAMANSGGMISHEAVEETQKALGISEDQANQVLNDVRLANYDVHAQAAKLALRQSLGVDDKEAAAILEDQAKLDWRGAGTALASKDVLVKLANAVGIKGKPGTMYVESEPTRLLSDGRITVNPKLIQYPDLYTEAVKNSGASEKAQAQAIKELPDVRRTLGKQALELFNGYPSSGFKEWIAKQPKLKGADDIDKALAYADHLRDDSGPIGKLVNQVVTRIQTGVKNLGVQGLGLYSMATGSESAATEAGKISKGIGQQIGMLEMSGANDSLLNRALGQTADMAPSVLVSMGGGLAGRGATLAFAGTKVGANILAKLSKAVRLAPTAKKAAEAVGHIANNAGFYGSAAAGGAQTAGAQFADTYAALRDQGYSHEDAVKASRMPALVSGAVTAILTTGFGKTGLHRIFADPATKAAVKGRFRSIIGGLIKGGAEQQPEELIDEAYNQVSTEMVSNPNANLAESVGKYLDNLPELALSVGVMGGAGGAIQANRDWKNTANDQPPAADLTEAPASLVLPEHTAAIGAAIDNWTPAGSLPSSIQDAAKASHGKEPTPEQHADVARTAAHALVDIANGQDPRAMSPEVRRALGIKTNSKTGAIEPLSKNVIPLVESVAESDKEGAKHHPVITDAAREWLAKEVPSAGETIKSSYAERVEQIKNPPKAQKKPKAAKADKKLDKTTAESAPAEGKAPAEKMDTPAAEVSQVSTPASTDPHAQLKANGGDVVHVADHAAAEKLAGRPVKKGRRAFTQRINGKPTVVVIDSEVANQKQRGGEADMMAEEKAHAQTMLDEDANPELAAAADAAMDEGHPDFDATLDAFMRLNYNGYHKLTNRQKRYESVAKIVSGEYKGKIQGKSIIALLKAMLAKLLKRDPVGTNAAVQKIASNVRVALGMDSIDEHRSESPKLPRELASAKPRYSYGEKQFNLEFENDIDRAAYIAAQSKPSKRDADFLAFAMKHTGMSEAAVRAHGSAVRAYIKPRAAAGKHEGTILIPSQLTTSKKPDDAHAILTKQAKSEPIEPTIETTRKPSNRVRDKNNRLGEIVAEDGDNLTVEWRDGETSTVKASDVTRSTTSTTTVKNRTLITQTTAGDSEIFVVYHADENGKETAIGQFTGNTNEAIQRAWNKAKALANSNAQKHNHAYVQADTVAGSTKIPVSGAAPIDASAHEAATSPKNETPQSENPQLTEPETRKNEGLGLKGGALLAAAEKASQSVVSKMTGAEKHRAVIARDAILATIRRYNGHLPIDLAKGSNGFSFSHDGKILINVKEAIEDVVRSTSSGPEAKAMAEKLFDHEVIHLFAVSKIDNKRIMGVWKDLPQDVKNAVVKAYSIRRVAMGQPAVELSDFAGGHEYFRAMIEATRTGVLSEQSIGSTLAAKWKKIVLDFLDILKDLKKQFASIKSEVKRAELTARVEAIRKEISDALDAFEKGIGPGESPARVNPTGAESIPTKPTEGSSTAVASDTSITNAKESSASSTPKKPKPSTQPTHNNVPLDPVDKRIPAPIAENDGYVVFERPDGIRYKLRDNSKTPSEWQNAQGRKATLGSFGTGSGNSFTLRPPNKSQKRPVDAPVGDAIYEVVEPSSGRTIGNKSATELFQEGWKFEISPPEIKDDTPSLKSEEPAAPKDAIDDALGEAFGGLYQNPAPGPVEQVALPKDRRDAMMKAASALVDLGLKTPQELAARLDKLAPNGALRQYARSFWRLMTGFDGELEESPDWQAIYADSTKIPQESAGKAAETPEISAKEQDEAKELEITKQARMIVLQGDAPAQTYAQLVRLYENQPKLDAKTSTSKINQAYSTPAPMAYAVSRLADVVGGKVVAEPSAGNGMLLIERHAGQTIEANEIDPSRRSRLERQGIVSSDQDATTWQPESTPDRVIANPPFGQVMEAGGKNKVFVTPMGETTSIDHAIVLQSLATMAEDGRAAFIIGGPPPTVRTPEARAEYYRKGKAGAFFAHLYGNNNVIDHFTVAGKLYNKQGAGWPLDVFVIQGKTRSANTLPGLKPPRMIGSWEELSHELERPDSERIRINQLSAAEMQQRVDAMAGKLEGLSGGLRGDSSTPGSAGVRNGQANSETATPDRGGNAEPSGDGTNETSTGSLSTNGELAGQSTGSASERVEGAEQTGERQLRPKQPVESSDFQAPFPATSGVNPAGLLAPKNLIGPMSEAMTRLKKDVGGDLVSFVREKLGYPKKADISKYFFGDQIDALAQAIHTAENGGALVIGDQTGTGKGRIAAGLMKYCVGKGLIPVFVTKDQQLYDAMLDDLQDIDAPEVVPVISNENIKEKSLKDKLADLGSQQGEDAFNTIRETGDLPGRTNAIFTSYDQIKADDAPGISKAERARSKRDMEPPPDKWRMAALRAVAPRAMFILDESHLAGGQSTTGWRFGSLLKLAKHAYYSSATFAKRPDNMGIYFRTNLGTVGGDINGLIELMQAGGVPAMQIGSSMLAQDGQYMRRERSYQGVTFQTHINQSSYERDKQLADNYTEGLRSIIAVQERMSQAANIVNTILSAFGKRTSIPVGNRARLESSNFSAKLHNLVRQYLLAIKANSAAQIAAKAIKDGIKASDGTVKRHKVIVAVENTMESIITDLDAQGLPLNYNGVLQMYLNQMKRIKVSGGAYGKEAKYFEIKEEAPDALKDTKDSELRSMLVVPAIDPVTGESSFKVDEEVSSELIRRAMMGVFKEAREIINDIQLADMPLSPIDAMRQAVEREGIRTGEMTGRTTGIDKNGQVYQRTPAEVKGKLTAKNEFNNSDLDFLIINKTGSTGVSMHASDKFKDQRPRMMMVVQANLDINEFMQTLGRIHRAGQVELPLYMNLQSALPAENRPAAITGQKMSMLNANTTSNADSEVTQKDGVDIFNQYGDEVVHNYLGRNPGLTRMLAQSWQGQNGDSKLTDSNGSLYPLGDFQNAESGGEYGYLSRSVTGHLAILPVEEQEAFWEAVSADYRGLIDYLDQIGKNSLRASVLDLKAETVSSSPFTPGSDTGSVFGRPSTLEIVNAKMGKEPIKADEALKIANKAKVTAEKRQNSFMESANERIEAEDKRKEVSARNWSERREDWLDGQRQQRDTIANALGQIGMFGYYKRDDSSEGYAFVEDVQTNGEKLNTPSAQFAIVRVNDSQDRLKIPVSQLSQFFRPHMTTDSMRDRVASEGWERTWEYGTQQAIVTGNLMAALRKLTENGAHSRVISYTKADGSQQMGIMLSSSVAKHLSENAENNAIVANADDAKAVIDAGYTIKNANGNVRLAGGDGTYYLYVPEPRSTGGKYWRDPALLKITGEFDQPTKGTFVAILYGADKLKQTFDYLVANHGERFTRPVDSNRALGQPPAGRDDPDSIRNAQRVPYRGLFKNQESSHGRVLTENINNRARAGRIIRSFERDWKPFFTYIDDTAPEGKRKDALRKIVNKFGMDGSNPESRALWEAYANMPIGQLVPEDTERVKEAKELLPYLENLSLGQPPAAPFYSKLAQVIEAKMPVRADANAVKGMVGNQSSGVKAEEIRWSGILPWLDSRSGLIAKADVLDYLRTEGAVRFEEHRMGHTPIDIPRQSNGIPEGYRITKSGNGSYALFTDAGNNLSPFGQRMTYEQAIELADKHFSENWPQTDGTKYSQYQLPGGENYREVVLVMPSHETPRPVKQSNGSQTWWTLELPNGAQQGLFRSEADAVKAIGISSLTPKTVYTSSHFPDVPNYVAHMRLNDRTDATGQPGTFIEEIQSDRHQAGREKGYVKDDLPNDWKIEKYGNIFHVKSPNGDIQAKGDTEADAKKVALGYLNNGIIEGYDKGIPDAPYRTTWPLQMFKRALAEAVSSGKKWIGWTTGETQNSRYDLSQQVDSLLYDPYNQRLIASKDGQRVMDDTVAPEKLPDYIGKEPAKKLLEAEKNGAGNHTLKGDQLKIEAVGMKGFYDNILPKEVGKYVKQWVGSVGQSTIAGFDGFAASEELTKAQQNLEATYVDAANRITKQRQFEAKRRGVPDSMLESLRPTNTDELKDEPDVIEARDRVAKAIKNASPPTPIWRVDITPQMKAGVEAGQALFAPPSAQNQTTKDIHEIRQNLKEANAGRSQYPVPPERLKAQAESLLRWAAATGNIIDRAGFEHSTTRHAGLGGGEEHEVWFDPKGGRIIKLTKPNAYGIQQDLTRYLDTIEGSNERFGDDIQIEGVVVKDGWPHILISQPFYEGAMAKQKEIDAFFKDQGYQRFNDGMYRDANETMVYDAFPRNVLKLTDGKTMPIDVQVRHAEGRNLYQPPSGYRTPASILAGTAATMKGMQKTESADSQRHSSIAASVASEGIGMARALAEIYKKPDTTITIDQSEDVPEGMSLIQENSSGIWIARDSQGKMLSANQNRAVVLVAASKAMQKPAAPAFHTKDLHAAYQRAIRGTSTAFTSIRSVFDAAKKDHPSLSADEFKSQLKADYYTGLVGLEPADRPETVEKAGQFTMRDSLGVVHTNMVFMPTNEAEAMDAADRDVSTTPDQILSDWAETGEALGAPPSAKDAEYMQAVKDGDVVKQQAMVDAAAKAAIFLYDENTTTKPDAVRGIPSGAVFHISKEPITEFKQEYKTDLSSMGFHFGTAAQAKFRGSQYDFSGSKPTLNRVFLKLKNPLRVSHMESFAPDWLADKMVADDLLDEDSYNEWQEEEYMPSEQEKGAYLANILKKQGYDGLVYENEKEGTGDSYVPFSANQIKSADPITRDAEGNIIPLSQRFNSDSDSILFQNPSPIDPTVANQGDTDENREAFARARGSYVSNELTQADFNDIRDKVEAQIDEDESGTLDNIQYKVANDEELSLEEEVARRMLANRLRARGLRDSDTAMVTLADSLWGQDIRDATETARKLAMRVDQLQTPQERLDAAMGRIIAPNRSKLRERLTNTWTPSAKRREIARLEGEIAKAATAASRASFERTLAEAKTRMDHNDIIDKMAAENREAVDKILARNGLTQADLTMTPDDRHALQTAVLELPQVKKAMVELSPEVQKAIEMSVRGYTDSAIARDTGLKTDVVERVTEYFRNVTAKQAISQAVTVGKQTLGGLIEGGKNLIRWILGAPPAPLQNMVNTGVKNAANVQAQVQAILNAAIPTRRNRNRRALHAAVVNGKKGQKITVFVPYDPTDWQQVYRVARELSTRESTVMNKVYEYWINGILSGPQTHVVNTASNTLSTLWHYGPQWFASATVNTIIRDPNSTQWGEFPKVWAGFIKGIQPAMKNFALAWRTEADPVESTYLDRPVTVMFNDAALEKAGSGRSPSIGGPVGRVVRSPGRFLVAMDAFAKTIIMHGEVSAFAYRLGKKRGLSGVALENFMASQIATHGSESWEYSLQTAKELTFQDENDITQAVEKVANSLKQAKFVGLLFKFLLPFVRTPTNIYRTGMRKAGGSAGLLLYRLGKAGFYKIHKGENFFDTYSKGKMVQDVSESVMAGILWMGAMALSEGDTDDEKKWIEFTGSRPYGVANAGERASQLRQEGGSNLIIIRANPFTGEKFKEPIRIPIGRYEPMALTIGTLTDAAREYKEWSRLPGGQQTADKLASAIMQHIVAQAQDKTFLQGVSSAAQLLEDLTQNRLSIGESFGKQLVNGVIPNFIRQPMRQMRTEMADLKKPHEILGSKLLGGALSDAESKVNEAGKAVTRRGGPVGNVLFPGATEPSKALFDTALKDWNARHPGEKWNPDPITKGDWYLYDPATGSKKGKFPLKDSRQISLFEKNIGIMFDKLAAQELTKSGYRPGAKVTPAQIETIKDARTAAIKRVRSMPPSAFTVKSK
jgi:hypothetical protein